MAAHKGKKRIDEKWGRDTKDKPAHWNYEIDGARFTHNKSASPIKKFDGSERF